MFTVLIQCANMYTEKGQSILKMVQLCFDQMGTSLLIAFFYLPSFCSNWYTRVVYWAVASTGSPTMNEVGV